MNNPYDVSFEHVFDQISEPLADELILTWKKFGMLPEKEDGSKRASQAVVIARNAAGEIIGISTAFPAFIDQLKVTMFAFRCMVAPTNRVPGLLTKLTVETRKQLEKAHQENYPACKGIITEIYNDKLSEKRREAVFSASGFVFIGYSKNGYQIRVYYFKGAKI